MYLQTKLPDTEVKHDPFTLPALVAWLRMMPADEKYDYWCVGHCLFGQYAKSLGVVNPYVGGFKIVNGQNGYVLHKYDEEWMHIAQDEPRTFGAALKRAEALL